MNKSYKIDRDTVIVTDDKNIIRKMSKYKDVEEILRLENENEVIDGLIEDKENTVNQNKKKKRYIHYKKIETLCIILGAMTIIDVIFMLWILFFSVNLSGLLSFVFLCAMGITNTLISLAFYASSIKLMETNERLSRDIKWLGKIKNQNQHQIAMQRQLIDSDAVKEETLVPVKELSQAERLHRIADLFSDTDSLSEIAKIDHVLTQIEETGRQKVFKR